MKYNGYAALAIAAFLVGGGMDAALATDTAIKSELDRTKPAASSIKAANARTTARAALALKATKGTAKRMTAAA